MTSARALRRATCVCSALLCVAAVNAHASEGLEALMAALEARVRANEVAAHAGGRARASEQSGLPRALIAPWQPGAPTAAGWTLREARETVDGPTLLFVSPSATPLEVVLAPATRGSGCFFRTAAHCAFYRGGAPARTLSPTLAAPAQGLVCEPGAPDAPAVYRGALLRNLWRGALAALALGLLPLALWALRRRTLAWPNAAARWGWLGLLALTGLGGALRFAFSPDTFLHEFYRATDTLTQYLHADGLGPLGFGPYGETGPALYRVVDALFGGGERAVFATNTVLATLTVPAVATLSLSLFGDTPRALFAAAVLALLPLHLRFSASEELYIPAVFFGTVAFAFVADYARHGELPSALGGAVALSLAAQSRPESLLMPLYGLALCLAAAPSGARVARLRAGAGLVAFALVGLLCAPRLLGLFEPGGGLGDARALLPLDSARLLGQAPFDVALTPPAMMALAVLGLAHGLRRDAAKAVWLLLVLLCVGALPLFFFDTDVYRARTQVMGVALFAVLAGGAWPALRDVTRASGRVAVALAAALALVVAAAAWSRASFVRARADQQEEWSFLVDAVPRLPMRDGHTLLTLTRNVGREWLGAFPWFLLRRARLPVALADLRDAVLGDAWPAAGDDTWFYQGTYCFYGYEDEPPPRPFNPRCAAVHDRFVMEPVLTRSLTAPPYAHRAYAPRPVTIGFYRLKARR